MWDVEIPPVAPSTSGASKRFHRKSSPPSRTRRNLLHVCAVASVEVPSAQEDETTHPSIDLVVDADCPNSDLACDRLRLALNQEGLELDWWEWRRGIDHVPDMYQDVGSPSIFVNGKDVVAGSSGNSRSCRLYPAPDGGLDRAPSVATGRRTRWFPPGHGTTHEVPRLSEQ